jgi:hypothetical protein
MTEETKSAKKQEEKKPTTLVVAKLPVIETADYTSENGESYHLLTIEQALTELLEKVRKIERSVA